MSEFWTNLPTDVLADQRRAETAQAWADAQRKQLAQSWVDLHLADAQAAFAPFLTRAQNPDAIDAALQDSGRALARPLLPQEKLTTFQGSSGRVPDAGPYPGSLPTPSADPNAGAVMAPDGGTGAGASVGGLWGRPSSSGLEQSVEEATRPAFDVLNRVGVGLQNAVSSVPSPLPGFLPAGADVVGAATEAGRANVGNVALMQTPDAELTPAQIERKRGLGLDLAMGVSGAGPEKAGAGMVPAVTEQLPLPMTLPAQEAPSLYDRASVVRFAGMLSGTATHLVNTAANAVSGVSDLALKPAQAGVDVARVGVGRALGQDAERTRYLAEWGPQAKGYAAGFWAGMQQVPRILAGETVSGALNKYDTRRLASGSSLVDAAVELPLRALTAADAVFRGAAFGGHAAALATRQATQEGLSGGARAARAEEILGDLSAYPRLLEDANKLAARAVFQEERGLTRTISEVRAKNVGTRAFFDVFLPFVRTPYNVAAQGAGMTTLGYAGAIKAAVNGQTGEAVDRAVRATVGTAALYAGLQMAAGGFLTGAYPTDPGERSTLPEGWKPYSVRIPRADGTALYVPLATTGALAVPLGVAANLHDAFKNGTGRDDLMENVYKAVGSTGKYMLDLSALQGFGAISKLVTEPERAAEAFTEGLASSAVPFSGLMRQVQQGLGDAQRDPHGPVEAFMAAIPGLSENVRTKQTALGADRERGPSGPVALVTGSRVGVEKPDSVLAALRDADVGIPEPPKTVTHEDFKNVPLTETEQRAYRRAAGDEISARVTRYLASKVYQRHTAEQRAAVLKDQVEEARAAAALKALKTMGAAEAKNRIKATKKAA